MGTFSATRAPGLASGVGSAGRPRGRFQSEAGQAGGLRPDRGPSRDTWLQSGRRRHPDVLKVSSSDKEEQREEDPWVAGRKGSFPLPTPVPREPSTGSRPCARVAMSPVNPKPDVGGRGRDRTDATGNEGRRRRGRGSSAFRLPPYPTPWSPMGGSGEASSGSTSGTGHPLRNTGVEPRSSPHCFFYFNHLLFLA